MSLLLLDKIDLESIVNEMLFAHSKNNRIRKETLEKIVCRKLGDTPNKNKVFEDLYKKFTLVLEAEKEFI
jgi:hypothetical protein